MNKISRYILVFITIVVLAITLPNLFWVMFDKPYRAPVIDYSCLSHKFLIFKYNNNDIIRTDQDGHIYTRDEFENTLPLTYSRQLMMDGTMPDSINGVPMDPHSINLFSARYKYTPRNQYKPSIGLYPLFESESGRAALEMPNDYFTIDRSIKFINAETNQVDQEKSTHFNDAFVKKGFTFPAKMVAGLPTTRKSRDDGYFLLDATHRLFHFKMIKGEPFIEYLSIPKGIEIQFIECVDVKNREYYAFVYDTQNNIYLLSQDFYELIKLPVEGFNPKKDILKVSNDIFYKTISLISDGQIKVWVIDDVYSLVATYSEKWPAKFEGTAGKVFSVLFPFELDINVPFSAFINFYPVKSPGFLWIIGNLIFAFIFVVRIRFKKLLLKEHLADFCIVVFTGLFGLIATTIFPDKNYGK